MLRSFSILPPLGPPVIGRIDWPLVPHFGQICAMICPMLGNEALHHVQVVEDGVLKDLFVTDFAVFGSRRFDGARLNTRATEIYRRSRPASSEGDEPPTIFGTAVLFDQPVWW